MSIGASDETPQANLAAADDQRKTFTCHTAACVITKAESKIPTIGHGHGHTIVGYETAFI